jgi:hypothetical protein
VRTPDARAAGRAKPALPEADADARADLRVGDALKLSCMTLLALALLAVAASASGETREREAECVVTVK